jgi:hypothetical protein
LIVTLQRLPLGRILLPDVRSKVLLHKYPAFPDFCTRNVTALRAATQFLWMQLEKISGMDQIKGNHEIVCVFACQFFTIVATLIRNQFNIR